MLDEPDETFYVMLSNATGARIGYQSQGTGTILDDDPTAARTTLSAAASGIAKDFTGSGTFTQLVATDANGDLTVMRYAAAPVGSLPAEQRSMLEYEHPHGHRRFGRRGDVRLLREHVHVRHVVSDVVRAGLRLRRQRLGHAGGRHRPGRVPQRLPDSRRARAQRHAGPGVGTLAAGTVQLPGPAVGRSGGHEHHLEQPDRLQSAQAGLPYERGPGRAASSVDNPSVVESTPASGGTSTNDLVFTLFLSQPATVPVTVAYQTADGTALVGDGDYTSTRGMITFYPATRARR